MAELWALKDELSPARQLDFNHINVEVDANMLLHKPYVGTSFNLFRNLMKNFLNCIVSHVYKESNRCVDSLAKMGVVQDMIFVFCMTHPLWWAGF